MTLQHEFYADAALFDMDGTLTDSIAAVEAAWYKVANEIGQDPKHVVAATHGKRAIDNLSRFKPHLKAHEMDEEVAKFEEMILFFADAYNHHGPGSAGDFASSFTPLRSDSASVVSTDETTPELTPAESTSPSGVSSRDSSIDSPRVRSPSFSHRLRLMLGIAARNRNAEGRENDSSPAIQRDDLQDAEGIAALLIVDTEKVRNDLLEAWQIEAGRVDRSVRILPGVKKLMNSIPDGRYAVATSGAKTYAFGCMKRVGITPPPVTITADDKRLKAGKPAPDPFLLAAECLGYDPARCVVFEDSPSGIRAGVASGATVIAVCTSHERPQIENCGAHYIVENLESVSCEVEGDLLKFKIIPVNR